MNSSTLADVLALLTRDPGQPRLTWYGDSGERIELSGAVLTNWVAKTTNLLVEELDAAPGDVVLLDLPAHWRTLVWALAAWRTGATVRTSAPGVSEAGTARAIVTSRPDAWLSDLAPGTDVIAVALPGLARSFGAPLPAGVLDAAADTMTYGDVVGYVPAPDLAAAALLDDAGLHVSHADLVPWAVAGASGPVGARTLLSAVDGAVPTLRAALGTWAGAGSVVLLGPEASERLADPEALARLVASERVTHTSDG